MTLKRFPREEGTLLGKLLHREETDALVASLRPYLRLFSLVAAPPGALTMPPLEIR